MKYFLIVCLAVAVVMMANAEDVKVAQRPEKVQVAELPDQVNVVDNNNPGGVKVVDNTPDCSDVVITNPDPAYNRPITVNGYDRPQLQEPDFSPTFVEDPSNEPQFVIKNPDPGFYRPVVGGYGYQQPDNRPAYAADGGLLQNRPPNSYPHYNNPYARGGRK